MTQALLRKRDREREALPDSIDAREPKRFHGEETDEEFVPTEELVNRLMRSLEEEIAATCFSSFSFSNSWVNSAASNIYEDNEDQTVASDSGFDLCYLLEASDDELGIPQKTVLDLKDEFCLSTKETSESLFEGPDLNSLDENWHLENSFENFQQIVVHEDT